MSAEILRRAASLMRERAEAVPVGPWEKEFSDVIRTDVPFGSGGYLVAECATVERATHIASWHPAVALAVADRLEREGVAWQRVIADHPDLAEAAKQQVENSGWLAVARAYLGESA